MNHLEEKIFIFISQLSKYIIKDSLIDSFLNGFMIDYDHRMVRAKVSADSQIEMKRKMQIIFIIVVEIGIIEMNKVWIGILMIPLLINHTCLRNFEFLLVIEVNKNHCFKSTNMCMEFFGNCLFVLCYYHFS